MRLETFLIAAWITVSALPQYSDTTSIMLLEFSEPMSKDSLFYVGNYSIVDQDNNSYKIYKVGIVKNIDSVEVEEATLIALIAERLPYRKEYTVTANNLKDLAGNKLGDLNKAWHFFNGFAPNKIQKPEVILRE